MNDYSPRPIYLAWDDPAFRADENVEIMNQYERWMYRTLLQRMFFTTSRPYLPSNDETLMRFAGCDDPRLWSNHKSRVLAQFRVFEVNGVKYLENPRVTRDWDKLMSEREKFSNLGLKSAASKRESNARVTDVSTDVIPDVAQEKLEGKVSEGKISRKESAPGTPALASVLESGQLGYYNRESVSTQSSKAITKRCADVWQTVKGTKSAVCRSLDLPNIKGDWEAMCSNHPADLIVAAFELWAAEMGFRETTQWPLSKFFSKAQEYMGKVEMMNGIGREVNQEAVAVAEAVKAGATAAEEATVHAAEAFSSKFAREALEKAAPQTESLEQTEAMLKELSK